MHKYYNKYFILYCEDMRFTCVEELQLVIYSQVVEGGLSEMGRKFLTPDTDRCDLKH